MNIAIKTSVEKCAPATILENPTTKIIIKGIIQQNNFDFILNFSKIKGRQIKVNEIPAAVVCPDGNDLKASALNPNPDKFSYKLVPLI